MNVLIVEDEMQLGKSLEQGLRESGSDCVWVRNGVEGLAQAQSRQFDVVLLDVMLPDLSGWDILARLRAAGDRTAVILLTALGSIEDRVKGLDAGADDYLVKPFAFAELQARMSAVCRRALHRPSTETVVGPLRLDLTNRRVVREGQEIELTPTEFSLLEYLMRYAGQVVTRKMLCEHLWEADWEGVTNVIEVHINRLRSKVDRGFPEQLIQTIRGRGYALRVG
jgi:two-component system OmpR family response regulator/two-component system copper resistance phosphate regulon response regulator CusR